jgi:hypothetical protein
VSMVNPVPPPPMPRPPRRFFADDVLTGRVNLDQYPLRYILLTPTPSAILGNTLKFGAGMLVEIDKILSAAEFLESRGWEVVTIEQGGMVAFLRRRPPA